MIQGWTVLHPSARERRLWVIAIAAGLVSSMVLVYGALAMDPRHPGRTWAAAALAAAAVAMAAAMRRRCAPGPRELRIAADGVPWIRTQPSAGSTMVRMAGPAGFRCAVVDNVAIGRHMGCGLAGFAVAGCVPAAACLRPLDAVRAPACNRSSPPWTRR